MFCTYLLTYLYHLMDGDGFVTRKVTVGLASHWLHISDISVSPPVGSRWWTPAYVCSL